MRPLRALLALALAASVGPAPAPSAAAPPAPAAPHRTAVATPAAATPPVTTPGTTVTIVAHEDDDLLFINPDVSRDIAAGRRVVTVFLTAGDAGEDRPYWQGRERGELAAYAQMAGVRNRWSTARVRLAGQPVHQARLVGRPITLLFLRLPDGRGYARHDYETMRRLWTGSLRTIRSVDGAARYTRETLTQALATVLTAYGPDVVRTLNYTSKHGAGDHSDHVTAAYFAYAAHLAYPERHTIAGYIGYPAEQRAANLSPAERDAKLATFLTYAQHDSHVCKTRAACLANTYGLRVARRYVAATRTTG